VNFSGDNLWRKSPNDSMSGCARERERKGGQKEGAKVVGTHRILRSLPAAMVDSGEQFREDGGVSGYGSRGRKGRGLWRLYGGV
jgi:hypothetical protein